MAGVNGVNGVKGGQNGTSSSLAAKYNLADHFIGGSHLDAAPPSKVKDFVAANGGHTVITNVRASRSSSEERELTLSGSHRKQRYRRCQGDPISTKMGLRDLRRRAGHPIHRHGDARRFGSERRLHSDGRQIR